MPAIPKDVREKLIALGERIKARRIRFGMSRTRLAEEVERKLAELHEHYQTQTHGMIRGVEIGRTFMTIKEVKALALVLNDKAIGDEYEALKLESGQ